MSFLIRNKGSRSGAGTLAESTGEYRNAVTGMQEGAETLHKCARKYEDAVDKLAQLTAKYRQLIDLPLFDTLPDIQARTHELTDQEEQRRRDRKTEAEESEQAQGREEMIGE